MDETNTQETDSVKLGAKHEIGKLVVGGIAAYVADAAAGIAYEKVLRAFRARKAR
jgi:hypothetical protein